MLFSVIVPVYNVEAYLPRCLDSILANSFTDCELILVDDGSTDQSARICDAYAEKDARIRVVHKPNGGLVSARNAGIRCAQGSYILYVDSDDWVSPDWMSTIENCISHAPVMPDIVAFGAERICTDRTALHVSPLPAGFYDRQRLEQEVFPRLIIDRSQTYGDGAIYPTSWNKAYKNELLQEHHCLNEGIRLAEDNAFVFECCLCAQSMVVCHEVLYHFNRVNPGSIRSRTDPERYRKLLRTFQYIESRLRPYAPFVEGQMDDFYASRIILEVFDTNKKMPDLLQAAGHVARELKATGLLNFVNIRRLPPHARAFIVLLKLHAYIPVCAAARLYVRAKE